VVWGKSRWGRDLHRPAGAYRLPADVQALPLTLKRAHLYPRSPRLFGEAVQEYRNSCAPCEAAAANMPEYLPQRMMFQQYKLAPAPRHPLASVYSVLEAARGDRSGTRMVVARVATPPSVMAPEDFMAAKIWNRLPASYEMPYQDYVARGISKRDRVRPPVEHEQFAAAPALVEQQAALERAKAKSRALQEAATARGGFRRIVSEGWAK